MSSLVTKFYETIMYNTQRWFNKPPSSIQFNGKQVKISAEPSININIAIQSTQFTDWLVEVEKDGKLDLHEVHFQSMDMFGPRIGFLKWKCTIYLDNICLPGIVFARGGSVAVLPVLECEGEEYTILCVQPRVALGKHNIIEFPAGMLDGENNFAGICAKELKEEADIDIEPDELIDMGLLAWGADVKGMTSQCGASDEFIRQFMFRRTVTSEELEEMNGKHTGELEAGETITLKICKLSDVWRISPDSKTMCLLHLYYMLNQEGKLN